jgi:hypothetical protein
MQAASFLKADGLFNVNEQGAKVLLQSIGLSGINAIQVAYVHVRPRKITHTSKKTVRRLEPNDTQLYFYDYGSLFRGFVSLKLDSVNQITITYCR